MIYEDYRTLLEKLGLKSILKYKNEDLWEEVCDSLDYLPVAFSKQFIEYQTKYFQSYDCEVFDLSIILLNDGKFCGLFPLCLRKESNGFYSLDSFGNKLYAPIFLGSISLNSANKISKNIFALIKEIKNIYVIDKIFLRRISNKDSLSELEKLFLKNGAFVVVEFESCIDMNMDVEQIKSNFRKSYKSLINQGFKIWNISIFDKYNITHVEWDDFKLLHFQQSGRKTRSDETWDLQLKTLLEGNAYYIALRNSHSELVGGAYFLTTKDEAIYGVAAYRRELFDKPIGHVVQYCAVQKNKEIGVKWYKIGERPFKQIKPEISEKEINIGNFKEGFSTDLFPILIFIYQ